MGTQYIVKKGIKMKEGACAPDPDQDTGKETLLVMPDSEGCREALLSYRL